MDRIKEVLNLKDTIVSLKDKRTRLETKIHTLQEEKQRILSELQQYNLTEETVQEYLLNMDTTLEQLKDKIMKMEHLLNKVL